VVGRPAHSSAGRSGGDNSGLSRENYSCPDSRNAAANSLKGRQADGPIGDAEDGLPCHRTGRICQWDLVEACGVRRPQEFSMSDELQIRLTSNDEFEEISSEEVDRMVEALDRLIESAQSENIKHYLEEAASNIYYLVYEEELDEEGGLEDAA
jgi:hypothetical protein